MHLYSLKDLKGISIQMMGVGVHKESMESPEAKGKIKGARNNDAEEVF